MKIFVLDYKVDFHLPQTSPWEHRMLVIADTEEDALEIGRRDRESHRMGASDWSVLSEHEIERGFSYLIY